MGTCILLHPLYTRHTRVYIYTSNFIPYIYILLYTYIYIIIYYYILLYYIILYYIILYSIISYYIISYYIILYYIVIYICVLVCIYVLCAKIGVIGYTSPLPFSSAHPGHGAATVLGGRCATLPWRLRHQKLWDFMGMSWCLDIYSIKTRWNDGWNGWVQRPCFWGTLIMGNVGPKHRNLGLSLDIARQYGDIMG